MKKNIPELRFPGFEGGWEEKRLGEVAVKVGSGSTPRGGEKVYQKQGVLFIRSQNVTGNKLDTKNSTFISSKMNEQMRGSQVLSNDILLNITGASIGRSCVVPDDFDAGNVNQHVCIIRLNKENTPYFTQAFLSSFSGQKKIMRTQVGGGREGINFQGVRSLRIFFPKQNEQKKIAEFLGFVDEWIDNLKAQKEKWEEYKKGIMQKIFSQEIRFKDEGGGDFPEWEEKRLGDVGKFLKGKGISKEDVVEGGDNKCIRYGELYTEYDEIVDDVVSRTNVSAGSSFLSKVGDLLVPSSGETAWDIATATAVLEDGVLLGSDMNVLRFEQVIDSRFLAYYLSYGVKRLLARLAQGNSVVHLYASNLRKMRLLIPFIGEQQKIVSYLSPVDEIIGCYEQKIIRAEEWKKGLIQKMFV